MKTCTLVSLAGLAFVFLAVCGPQMEAEASLILPIVIYKKLPKHDHQGLHGLLQFINLDAVKGLIGQLINFDAILKLLSPMPAKTTTSMQTGSTMMMDDPGSTMPMMPPSEMPTPEMPAPEAPPPDTPHPDPVTLPAIPTTSEAGPELEMGPSGEGDGTDCEGDDSFFCPQKKVVTVRRYVIRARSCPDGDVWCSLYGEHLV